MSLSRTAALMTAFVLAFLFWVVVFAVSGMSQDFLFSGQARGSSTRRKARETPDSCRVERTGIDSSVPDIIENLQVASVLMATKTVGGARDSAPYLYGVNLWQVELSMAF